MNVKNDKIDPTPLIQRLIEKSKAGKLNWEPTASRKQFVTSIGGDKTFRIKEITVTDYNEYGERADFDIPILEMLDVDGNLIWEIEWKDAPPPLLNDLFKIARRIGNRVDDQMSDAIDALDKL